MQPDTITVPVDTLNNGTTTDEIYTRFEEYQNRSVYIGASHTMAAKDQLSLYRSFPKTNGNFKGVSKTSIKFAREHSVLGVDGLSNLTAPVIVEVSFSIPVGITAAQSLIARQRVVALLDNDTIMAALNDQLMV